MSVLWAHVSLGFQDNNVNLLKSSYTRIFDSISIHKALAGLDVDGAVHIVVSARISIHKALAGLDVQAVQEVQHQYQISIHKALAGLDY